MRPTVLPNIQNNEAFSDKRLIKNKASGTKMLNIWELLKDILKSLPSTNNISFAFSFSKKEMLSILQIIYNTTFYIRVNSVKQCAKIQEFTICSLQRNK